MFTRVVGAAVGIASASFTLIFSLTTGIVKKLLSIARNKKKKHDKIIVKKLLSIARNKKKKHDKILMLAKSKLKSIETLISQALIDME